MPFNKKPKPKRKQFSLNHQPSWVSFQILLYHFGLESQFFSRIFNSYNLSFCVLLLLLHRFLCADWKDSNAHIPFFFFFYSPQRGPVTFLNFFIFTLVVRSSSNINHANIMFFWFFFFSFTYFFDDQIPFSHLIGWTGFLNSWGGFLQ